MVKFSYQLIYIIMLLNHKLIILFIHLLLFTLIHIIISIHNILLMMFQIMFKSLQQKIILILLFHVFLPSKSYYSSNNNILYFNFRMILLTNYIIINFQILFIIIFYKYQIIISFNFQLINIIFLFPNYILAIYFHKDGKELKLLMYIYYFLLNSTIFHRNMCIYIIII